MYKGYKDQMWGVVLTTRDLRRILALGAEVDMDLYAGGPDLGDGER